MAAVEARPRTAPSRTLIDHLPTMPPLFAACCTTPVDHAQTGNYPRFPLSLQETRTRAGLLQCSHPICPISPPRPREKAPNCFATCCRRWDLAVAPVTRRRGNRVTGGGRRRYLGEVPTRVLQAKAENLAGSEPCRPPARGPAGDSAMIQPKRFCSMVHPIREGGSLVSSTSACCCHDRIAAGRRRMFRPPFLSARYAR